MFVVWLVWHGTDKKVFEMMDAWLCTFFYVPSVAFGPPTANGTSSSQQDPLCFRTRV